MRPSVYLYLMVFFTVFLSGFSVSAQDRDSLMLHFRLNESQIDPAYMDNGLQLDGMADLFGQGIVERVSITVSSSPSLLKQK